MSAPKPSLLFITRIAPGDGGGGAQVYSFDVLSNLVAQGFDVQVLLLEPCLLQGRLPWIYEQLPSTPFRQVCPGYFKLGRRLWHIKGICWAIRNRLARWFKFLGEAPALPGAMWGNELTAAEERWVRAAKTRQHWDAVICNYCWLSRALDVFGQNVRKAILTHDVWHKHIARQSGNECFQRLDRAAETKYLNSADTIIAITENDAANFREMLPEKEVVCASMSCVPHFSRQPTVSGELLFVGSDYRPNVDGMIWFLNEVAPILEQKMPGHFHLHLVGTVGAAMPVCQSSIACVVRGRVGNLAAEYARAEIVIVPILSGTGLKIKLVEAIAHGKAIVSTAAGAQGLEDLAGKTIQVITTPEDFAQRLVEISVDEKYRSDLEAKAEAAAMERFSPEACYAPLARALKRRF